MKPSRSSSPLIYVVDDEAMILTLIEAILAPAGYRLKLFRDPAEALKSLKAERRAPNLVITDFAMGAINGLEVIAQARQFHASLPTLLISGNMVEGLLRFAPSKPDRFLAKPFQSRALLEAVSLLVPDRLD